MTWTCMSHFLKNHVWIWQNLDYHDKNCVWVWLWLFWIVFCSWSAVSSAQQQHRLTWHWVSRQTKVCFRVQLYGVLLNWKRKSLQVFLWIWMPCPPTEKTYNELGLQFFNSNVCNPIYYSASYHLYCISYFITVVLLLLLVFYLRTCEIAIQVTLTHSFTHSDVNKKNKRISG